MKTELVKILKEHMHVQGVTMQRAVRDVCIALFCISHENSLNLFMAFGEAEQIHKEDTDEGLL